jgi:methyltransferase
VFRSMILMALVFIPMILEARRSRGNERVLRARGAFEPRDDVYAVMQVAYPGCFLAIIAEGWWRGPAPVRWIAAGALVFAAGKALKYWAIATLGMRWTFRVLVPSGMPRITSGPYRWLRHPNYVGVAAELAGAALIAGAPIAGVLSFLVFGGLMLARITVEERAMDVCER